MKSVITLHILFLVVQVFTEESRQTDLPDEDEMSWNFDLNTLGFTNLLVTEEESKDEPPATHEYDVLLENQPDILFDQLKVEQSNVLEFQAKQYIKRYINLFLIKCGLQDVPESDKDIKVDLEFSIAKEDLIFLKELANDISLPKLQDNLFRIDKIFDNGLQMKQESIYQKSWSFLNFSLSYLSIPPSWYYTKIFYYVVIFVLTILIAVLLKSNNISYMVTVLMIMNNFILLEGILDYINKVKVAETEDHIRFIKAQGSIQDACDPDKQTIWSKIIGLFKDECLNQHLAIATSKVDEVSPLNCILDAYNQYLFQYPFKVSGSAIRVFSESLYGSLTYGWILTYLSYIWIIPLFTILIFCLMKPNIRFNFFGTGLDIGFAGRRSLAYRRNELEPVPGRRIQEIEKRESIDIAGGRAEETTVERFRFELPRFKAPKRPIRAEAAEHPTGDEPIEGQSDSKVTEEERNGTKNDRETTGSNPTLLDDIATAKEIVKEIKEGEH